MFATEIFNVVREAVAPFQNEIVTFFLALLAHYVLFGMKLRTSHPNAKGSRVARTKSGAIAKQSPLNTAAENARNIASLRKEHCDEGRVEKAVAIFQSCPEKTANNYSALISLCVREGDLAATEQVMAEAIVAGVADVNTFNLLMKARVQSGDEKKARQTMKEMRSVNVSPNSSTLNELLDVVVKCNSSDAWSLIDEMGSLGARPNRTTYSILLKSSHMTSGNGCLDKLINLADTLDEDIGEVLLRLTIETCIRFDRKDLLKNTIQRQLLSRRTRLTDPHSYDCVIRGFGMLQNMQGVWATWRELRMHHVQLTSVTIGCMAEALATNADPDGGYDLIREVLGDPQTKPLVNAIIYGSVLKGFAHQKRFDRVWALYNEMLKVDVKFSIVTFNTLVDGCARCGEMGNVQSILEEMAKREISPNVITYSTILKGYCEGNHVDQALKLLEEMKINAHAHPDEHTYNILINGCARTCKYQQGMMLLDEMCAAGVSPSNFTLTVLVKLACRAKRLDKAFEICEELATKYKLRLNVHVYNALVQGCTNRSDLSRSLSVMELMVKERVRPDARTYTMLLRACIQLHEPQDAAGLLRAAHGLNGAHRLLEGASKGLLVPHGGLAGDLIAEVLEGISKRCSNSSLAKELSSELHKR